jgi:alpha-glucosidase
MLLLTLRGTPTIYYGDEIGLEQITVPPDQARDPFERNVPGLGLGRDGCRGPMQWEATAHAGFSTVTPWLPVEQTFSEKNVARMRDDPASIYQLYRRLLALRRRCRALTLGSFHAVAVSGDLLLFNRVLGDERLLVALNFADAAMTAPLGPAGAARHILLSTFGDRAREVVGDRVLLRPHEGIVIECSVPATPWRNG